MKRTIAGGISVFAIASLASFATLRSNTADASYTATDGYSCPRTYCDAYNCTLYCGLAQSTSQPIGTLQGAYFDLSGPSGYSYSLNLLKRSYTGAVYSDYANGTFTGGAVDRYVAASNVKIGASQWDYLSANLTIPSSQAFVTGVTVVGQ